MIEGPKTWQPYEIRALIERELKEYRHDCQVRQRQYTHQEAADLIYSALDDAGLINDTP